MLSESGLPNGRTFEGVWFELFAHYVVHKIDIFDLTDRDDIADIGRPEVDNNANFFEVMIRGIISGLENHFYDKT